MGLLMSISFSSFYSRMHSHRGRMGTSEYLVRKKMNEIDNNEEYIHTKLIKNKTEQEQVKILNKYYGFEESIQDLEKFIHKHILYEKEYWLNKIENYKKEKGISMRNFNVEFTKYGEKYKNKQNFIFTREEDKMLDDLMCIWG